MNLEGKKVLIYGSGKSGQGAAELLKKVGAVPEIFDDSMGSPKGIPSSYDLLVMSPGVPTDLPRVEEFRAAGVKVWGEVELAYETGKGRVLAVTGTNGKTTTTSLLGEIMKAWEKEVFVVGNIGTAYTSVALDTTEHSTVVAEISSFQLETIERFRPEVSAILNITEDHLNRHHTMEEYIRVKEGITKNQDRTCTCVLNYEDEILRKFAETCPASVLFFSSERELEEGFCLIGDEIVLKEKQEKKVLVRTGELQLIGKHNFENVMAASAMAYRAGVPLDTIASAAKKFKAVEHRIEYSGTVNGVLWYNDSKGTNPDAAIKGIQAMKWPTFLIAGGYDKGSDYHEWIRSFDGKVKCLVLEGKTKEDIRRAALECGYPEAQIVMKENMNEAMEYCASHAEPGDAVLLSPACASWGEFPNYEVRGKEFKEFVKGLA
ncbi:MAG: UDP-N-acetylmuramoyl-L-alanine--D-glutamate ligase [Lachnospiraceae bacterium]|jgi:UDP-N-acetylmuramoylalanine--D-glutamate ligase|nr:UDP-N-acetylmuramoyl-L-alanine--D-glutamate ligase [Lachnospiraceae bacterium]